MVIIKAVYDLIKKLKTITVPYSEVISTLPDCQHWLEESSLFIVGHHLFEERIISNNIYIRNINIKFKTTKIQNIHLNKILIFTKKNTTLSNWHKGRKISLVLI